MADGCPVPGPDDPLVQGLLASTDCHVEGLVRGGYSALFEGGGGAFGGVLEALLTVWVALIGYRLLLGRSQLSVGEFALSAVKLGAVVALATQWGTYQALVYRALFDGPQEIAGALMHGLSAHGAASGGDVFDGLQRAFDDLTAFSPAAPPGSAAAAAPATATGAGSALAAAAPTGASLGSQAAGAAGSLLSKGGFDAMLLLFSAVGLLLSTLGVLLMAKVVLGLLLALGPVFIACLLFDSTRGVFEGWLRASLGFAFAPLATTVTLGLSLTLLGPYLDQIETMRDQHVYTPGVAFAVLVLVLVFAGVAGGMLLAAGVLAGGFRLPGLRRAAARTDAAAAAPAPEPEPATLGRAERAANAVAAQAVRDQAAFARSGGAGAAAAAAALSGVDRRTSTETLTIDRGAPAAVTVETRLGQAPRRQARPRAARSSAPPSSVRSA